MAPDDVVIQPRSRGLARSLSDEHVVFDLRDPLSNSEVYQGELTRLVTNLKKSRPASEGVPEPQGLE